jgi:hypothetical protein
MPSAIRSKLETEQILEQISREKNKDKIRESRFDLGPSTISTITFTDNIKDQ